MIASSILFFLDMTIIKLAIRSTGKNMYLKKPSENFKMQCLYFIEAKDRVEVFEHLLKRDYNGI